MRVELIYDRDCPNVAAARASLIKALAAAGHPVSWTEWDSAGNDAPPYARSFGSPTVLVDGRDVMERAAIESGIAPYCRIYKDRSGRFTGVPPVDQIMAALSPKGREPRPAPGSTGWRTSLASGPGIAFSFLPNALCPACWPAYAGILSTLGVGVLLEDAWLLPLTAAFLAMAVGALAFRARTRRGYRPFAAGLTASVGILAGKFAWESDIATYSGIGLLVAASLWNAWPMRRVQKGNCPACTPESSARNVHPPRRV